MIKKKEKTNRFQNIPRSVLSIRYTYKTRSKASRERMDTISFKSNRRRGLYSLFFLLSFDIAAGWPFLNMSKSHVSIVTALLQSPSSRPVGYVIYHHCCAKILKRWVQIERDRKIYRKREAWAFLCLCCKGNKKKKGIKIFIRSIRRRGL